MDVSASVSSSSQEVGNDVSASLTSEVTITVTIVGKDVSAGFTESGFSQAPLLVGPLVRYVLVVKRRAVWRWSTQARDSSGR